MMSTTAKRQLMSRSASLGMRAVSLSLKDCHDSVTFITARCPR
jgi:hypothetical protein